MQNFNKIGLLILTWWILWIALSGWFLMHESGSAKLAIIDSLVSNLILSALCTGVLFSMRTIRPEALRLFYLLVAIIFSALFHTWISHQILVELFKEETNYIRFIDDASIIRFLVAFFMITLFAMIGWIIYFIKEQLDEKNRIQESNRLAKESELIHLRQQLQPHFLFNTLNSVVVLTGSDPESARKMIHQLSEFLRGTLRKSDDSFVSLQEKLQNIELYLAIEKVRFGDRLQTMISTDENAALKKIPPFLLQPLVENAIKFGLYDTLDSVTIDIQSHFESSYLQVSISNPYDVTAIGSVPGTGFGLSAISRRLYLLFGRNDLFETNGANGKFTVTLKIPQSQNV